jgi:hypothetical protein
MMLVLICKVQEVISRWLCSSTIDRFRDARLLDSNIIIDPAKGVVLTAADLSETKNQALFHSSSEKTHLNNLIMR